MWPLRWWLVVGRFFVVMVATEIVHHSQVWISEAQTMCRASGCAAVRWEVYRLNMEQRFVRSTMALIVRALPSIAASKGWRLGGVWKSRCRKIYSKKQ